MIKVLKKATEIIEFIARQEGRPVAPSRLVAALSLNQPTCIRILKDLVELGYLEQVSRQQGYRLGPFASWLSQGRMDQGEQGKITARLVRECAEAIGESVLLAVRHGHRRHIICHHNSNAKLNIDVSAPFYDDLYTTATGRVLLAYASEAELKRIIVIKGLPSLEAWPEAADAKALEEQLSAIRKDRQALGKNHAQAFHIAAYPVFKEGVFFAALGASIPFADAAGDALDLAFQKVAATALAISNNLSAITSAG